MKKPLILNQKWKMKQKKKLRQTATLLKMKALLRY